MKTGGVRRGQLVTTYGVGAVVALEDESFMTAGLDHWTVGPPNLHEKRLERELDVQGFVVPPASGAKSSEKDVPVVRFPQMYFCPGDECEGRLERHKFFAAWNKNKCNRCNSTLVPSRFVVVCEQGHIDDFPYFEWVHKGTPIDKEKKEHVLKIKATGAGASLADVVVSCSCGKSSTMQGSLSKNALRNIKYCTGRRPWLGDSEECECVPRALQRGASNVYFSVTASAISIPPWSEGAHKIINAHWTFIDCLPDAGLEAILRGFIEKQKITGYSAEELAGAVRQRKGIATGEGPVKTLREEEYEALSVGRDEAKRDQEFVCVPGAAQSEVSNWFDKVMLANRLREVMALTGFTRLLPLSSEEAQADKSRIAPLAKETKEWLPAIEMQGEGVFLRLGLETLHEWEKRPNVRSRAARINENYKRKFAQYGAAPPLEVTPRLIMIHTLAHILINQWSLDCGYPAGSLRERLYVSQPGAAVEMAGLLIYTATTDAAGSLGGVVALADVGKLRPALEAAIAGAAWCSSDPLCIEADAAGADSLNLAACHSCALLPEVSCEKGNSFLDRALLVGTLDDPELGFFSNLTQQA